MQEKKTISITGQKPNNANQGGSFSDYWKEAQAGFWRIWKNRWLWFWGIFIPLGMSFNYGVEDSQLGEEEEFFLQNFFTEAEVEAFFEQHLIWFLMVGLILFALVLLWWFLSAVARAGVIRSLAEMQDPTKSLTFDFKKIWQQGKESWAILFRLDVLAGVSIFLVFFLVALPFLSSGQDLNSPFFSLTGGLIVFFLAIVFGFLKNMVTVEVVLVRDKIISSLGRSYYRLLENKKEAGFLLLLFFIGSFVSFFIFLAIIALLVFPALWTAHLSGFFEREITINSVLTNFSLPFLLLVGLGLWLKSLVALWQTDLWVWWVKRIAGLRNVNEDEEEAVMKKESVMEKV